MASGMKIWSTLCIAGVAAVTVLLLPPKSADDYAPGARVRELPRPAGRELVRLEERAGVLNEQLIRLRLQDLIDEALAAAVAADERVVTRFLPWMTGEEAMEEFRSELSAEWGRDDVILGVLHVERTHGSEVPTDRPSLTTEIFAGTAPDGSPYCVWIVRTAQALQGEEFQAPGDWSGLGPLNLCSYWARFGPPGPHIEAWFEAGAYSFAREGSSTSRSYGAEAALAEDLPFGFAAVPLQSPAAQRLFVSAAACMRDGPATCAEEALDTTAFHEHSAGSFISNSARTVYHEAREHTDLAGASRPVARPSILVSRWFAELEEREGADALARFWTSELPVEQAFETAFGTDVGSWIRAWIERTGFDGGRGPSPGLSAAGLSLLTLLAAAGIGAVLQRRRTTA